MDMQQAPQLTVHRAIDRTGYVKYAAIDQLLGDGRSVTDPTTNVKAAGLTMRLTDLGRERLGAG